MVGKYRRVVNMGYRTYLCKLSRPQWAAAYCWYCTKSTDRPQYAHCNMAVKEVIQSRRAC